MYILLPIITVKWYRALCGAHFTKTQSGIKIKALKQKMGKNSTKKVHSSPRSPLSGQLNKHNFQIIFKLHELHLPMAMSSSLTSGQTHTLEPSTLLDSGPDLPRLVRLTWGWVGKSVKKADEILLSKCTKNFRTERITQRCCRPGVPPRRRQKAHAQWASFIESF